MQNHDVEARDQFIFRLRWLLLGLLCVLLVLSDGAFDVPMALVVGVLANLIALPLAMPSLKRVTDIALMIADMLLFGAFVFAASASEYVVVAAGIGLLTLSMLRAKPINTGITAVMFVFTALLMPVEVGVVTEVTWLTLGLLGIMLSAGAYVLDQHVGGLARTVDRLQHDKSAQMEDIRARTRAISDVTYTMSSTLNYRKVLDAALEAGRLGLRMPERDANALTAGIYLFHVEDGSLHVVSSRRYTRGDELRTLSGKVGVVGEALREAIPVFGKDAINDPELCNFIAFQKCKSLLVIPLRAGFDNFGVLLYGSESSNAFTQDHSDILTSIGIQATIALQNAVLYSSLIEEKERIVDLDEEARKKLARDLHDGPTQGVAAIAMRMSYIQKLYKKSPEQIPDELKKVEDLARKTTKEIRHMLFTLRPLVLETQGLSAALNQLAEKMYEMHGQAIAVRIEGSVEEHLDHQQHGVIFYIVEEAINNARKYAEAKMISVTIRQQNDMAILQIADNGKGFDIEKVMSNYDGRGSLGMVNMRERAELLDGTFSIDSVQGRGTVITVLLPLKSPEIVMMNGSRGPTTKLAMAAAARVERAVDRPYSY